MKRERTKDYDVLRLVDTISIVERKSGAVVGSFAIPSEETRAALVRLLSDPVKSCAADDETTPETAPEKAETTGDEKQATKPKTTKKSNKKAAS